jgi:hypothetical protein
MVKKKLGSGRRAPAGGFSMSIAHNRVTEKT